MELRVLRYFVESAKANSMTKAAEKLHVTQPTLSKQIKELERELGQKLFVRGNYTIHLTPEGEILYKRALDLLELESLTLQTFASMGDFNGGDIHLGCAESQGISLLAKAGKELAEMYPATKFHLYSGNRERVCERLDKGLLDFAVVVQNVDLSRYGCLSLPTKDTWGLILPKNSREAEKTEIPITDLIHFPLIVSRQGATSEMPPWLQENYEKLHIVATYDLLFNATILVREGLGYALAFDKLVYTGKESDLCFRPIVPEISSPMYLIWRKDQKLSKAAGLFLEKLQQLCANFQ